MKMPDQLKVRIVLHSRGDMFSPLFPLLPYTVFWLWTVLFMGSGVERVWRDVSSELMDSALGKESLLF